MTSAGLTEENETKKARRYEELIIYSICGLHHVLINYKLKAYFWVISALEASKWFQITFCILTNILNSISERFGPNFEQIDISLTVLAITSVTVACILIDKLKLSR